METTSAPAVATMSTGHDFMELTRSIRELFLRIIDLIEEHKRLSATVRKERSSTSPFTIHLSTTLQLLVKQ
jgi:hypothetical protein